LAVGDAEEGGLHRFSLHRKLSIPREEICPWEGFGLFEEFIEGGSFKLAHFEADAVRNSQPEVAAADGKLITGEFYPAVFYAYILIAELLYLFRHH
jgi:hypothetical protein